MVFSHIKDQPFYSFLSGAHCGYNPAWEWVPKSDNIWPMADKAKKPLIDRPMKAWDGLEQLHYPVKAFTLAVKADQRDESTWRWHRQRLLKWYRGTGMPLHHGEPHGNPQGLADVTHWGLASNITRASTGMVGPQLLTGPCPSLGHVAWDTPCVFPYVIL